MAENSGSAFGAPQQICMRCGRSPAEVPGDWNEVWDHGYLVGYLCPDDQTAEEYAEAEINLATGTTTAPRVEVLPGDPGYDTAREQHLSAVLNDVYRDWMKQVAELKSQPHEPDATVTFDPYALADRALDRLAGTIGNPKDEARDTVRESMANQFRDWMNENLSP